MLSIISSPLVAAAKKTKKAAKKNTAVAPATHSCIVCLDDKNIEDFCTLSCGHEFCTECLEANLEIALKDKSTAGLRCPDPTCKSIIENTDIAKITQDKEKLKLLDGIQLREWFSQQPNGKNCPTVDCDYSFINDGGMRRNTTCPQCHQTYCANCLFRHNIQVPCEQAAEDRATDPTHAEFKNAAWIKKNTKKCPRCNVNIQKNDGCNHMTCRNQACRHEFCWICMANWNAHYECRPAPEEPTDDTDDEEEALRQAEAAQQEQRDEEARLQQAENMKIFREKQAASKQPKNKKVELKHQQEETVRLEREKAAKIIQDTKEKEKTFSPSKTILCGAIALYGGLALHHNETKKKGDTESIITKTNRTLLTPFTWTKEKYERKEYAKAIAGTIGILTVADIIFGYLKNGTCGWLTKMVYDKIHKK